MKNIIYIYIGFNKTCTNLDYSHNFQLLLLYILSATILSSNYYYYEFQLLLFHFLVATITFFILFYYKIKVFNLLRYLIREERLLMD